MVDSRKKGYRVENKIRKMFEKAGWRIVRSGASLGEADLICLKDGKCALLQIKATAKKKFYFREYMDAKLAGHPFHLVVDFGYGKIRVMPPQKIVVPEDGEHINDFLKKS